MKRIRDFIGGMAHISQSAIETDFVANCLKNQEVLLAVAEEVLKQQTMQSVALARLEAEMDRLKADLKRLEETMSQKTVEPHQLLSREWELPIIAILGGAIHNKAQHFLQRSCASNRRHCLNKSPDGTDRCRLKTKCP